jgi:hypothetical protein
MYVTCVCIWECVYVYVFVCVYAYPREPPALFASIVVCVVAVVCKSLCVCQCV